MDLSRLLAGDNQLENQTTNISAVGKQSQTKRKRRWRPSLKQLRDKNQRDSDNSRILNLTLDVNDLRQQVHDCQVQINIRETRLLVAREQFHARSLQSVDHFFQLFKHGYPRELTTMEQSYLTGLLDENIDVGGGVTGRMEFYDQWRRYKKLFSVRRISTFTTTVITSDARGCLIGCSGEFEGRVTVAALETVFPRAREDKTLVERVLLRRFVCPTKTLISFDANGRLVQYDASSDVFEAMNQLLDCNPFQVVKLMADVTIGDGSLLPPVDDGIDEDEDDGDATCNQQEYDVGGASPVSSTNSAKNSIDFILS
ncbi:hypothetical protein PHMEG_00026979 [Phytophthora megakarya]|uniref:Bzip transcription factor n=1 Tax=Phytophthora megakarya TaxID=4795 RepID=A0A225V800_9STRA|nr:hypothetical protein PHMEG_00026979 [Phytophthora megakarya]